MAEWLKHMMKVGPTLDHPSQFDNGLLKTSYEFELELVDDRIYEIPQGYGPLDLTKYNLPDAAFYFIVGKRINQETNTNYKLVMFAKRKLKS